MKRLTDKLCEYYYIDREKWGCLYPYIKEQDVVTQFGKVEDLMEKHNIESVEELENLFKIEFSETCWLQETCREQDKKITEILKENQELKQQLENVNDLLKKSIGCSNCKYTEEYNQRIKDLEQEQIEEMKEHQKAMSVADEKIKYFDQMFDNITHSNFKVCDYVVNKFNKRKARIEHINLNLIKPMHIRYLDTNVLRWVYVDDLLHLEQFENQFDVLPCKVRDTIYYINFPTMSVNEYKVSDLKIETFTTNKSNIVWLAREYGSCWFLNKQEAEAKLKELKGE